MIGFGKKTKIFFTLKTVTKPAIGTPTEKRRLNPLGENRRTLALMRVEISAKKSNSKMAIFDKKVNFLKSCWSDHYENLHASGKDSFVEIKTEQKGSFEIIYFQKNQKTFSRSSSRYKVKQSTNRD